MRGWFSFLTSSAVLRFLLATSSSLFYLLSIFKPIIFLTMPLAPFLVSYLHVRAFSVFGPLFISGPNISTSRSRSFLISAFLLLRRDLRGVVLLASHPGGTLFPRFTGIDSCKKWHMTFF